MQIERDVASRFELDLAEAAFQRIQVELPPAFAFVAVIVVLQDLLFEEQGKFVGEIWQRLALARGAADCEFALFCH